jgi:hypothetical protein
MSLPSFNAVANVASTVVGFFKGPSTSPAAPTGPAGQPQATPAGPEGLAGRASQDAGMAPRQNLTLALGGAPQGGPSGPGATPPLSTADLSKMAANVGNEANKAAVDDGGAAMQNVLKANMMNMEFQANMGVIAMQKGMVEAVAKTIKDVGTKVAQLAG